MQPDDVKRDDDALVDEKIAAKFLDVTPATLQVWRSAKRYPLPYVKIGRSVRYRMGALREFVESRTVSA